jgi:hypothetical protein
LDVWASSSYSRSNWGELIAGHGAAPFNLYIHFESFILFIVLPMAKVFHQHVAPKPCMVTVIAFACNSNQDSPDYNYNLTHAD